MLLIAAVQFLTTGVVAELMARTYFESSNVKPYVRKWDEQEGDASESDWYVKHD